MTGIGRPRDRRILLLGCSISGFMTSRMNTVMNLSLVSIGESFEVGPHSLAYITSVFLLMSLLWTIPVAKLADIHGKKKMFAIGLLAVVAGGVLGSVAPSFPALILCRAFMGMGSAFTAVAGISLITDYTPKSHRGVAIGIYMMCVNIGLVAGPPVGGFLNDCFGWHSLFLAVLPMSVASLICLSAVPIEIVPNPGGKLDFRATAYYMLSMG